MIHVIPAKPHLGTPRVAVELPDNWEERPLLTPNCLAAWGNLNYQDAPTIIPTVIVTYRSLEMQPGSWDYELFEFGELYEEQRTKKVTMMTYARQLLYPTAHNGLGSMVICGAAPAGDALEVIEVENVVRSAHTTWLDDLGRQR